MARRQAMLARMKTYSRVEVPIIAATQLPGWCRRGGRWVLNARQAWCTWTPARRMWTRSSCGQSSGFWRRNMAFQAFQDSSCAAQTRFVGGFSIDPQANHIRGAPLASATSIYLRSSDQENDCADIGISAPSAKLI